MTRLAALVGIALWAATLGGTDARAQSRAVDPRDLSLTVTVEAGTAPRPLEMVLLTIEGVYGRHITRERLEQPDLGDVNWMQLGQDHWFDDRVNGQKVKRFRRRMALFPERAGRLEIGAFTHHLTLTDEGDRWFEHPVRSEPITIEVQPLPAHEGWWLPARRLEISDTWSNPPDQLREGEGVLRVIRIEAVGVAPEMLPPMPDLASPSAGIFAHPERRFVDLSPEGPVSHAFWRWTIRPTNGVSAILEPIELEFFDTVARRMRIVRISPQRVAFGERGPEAPPHVPEGGSPRPEPALAAGGAAFVLALAWLIAGRRLDSAALRRSVALLDPDRRALARAARRHDLAGLRRAAAALARCAGRTPETLPEIAALDAALFGDAAAPAPAALVRSLARRLRAPR